MNKTLKALERIFLIFILGSVLGYVYETILVFFQTGHYESRQGLIYGPFTPVYGIGGVVYYLFFEKVKIRKLPQVFLVSMLLGGTTEYIASLVQEWCFGTRSWDYSYLLFDINGRTSLLHCCYWGIAGILYIKGILPLIEKAENSLEKKFVQNITMVLVIFMTFNISISIMASVRQEQRMNNQAADNKIEAFLDKRYPDERLDRIFSNKKYVRQEMKNE